MNPELRRAAEDLPFLKVTGGGNDFVLVDNRNHRLQGDLAEFVRAVCDRGFGVGADGMILLGWSERADLRMTYFNRDGGEAALCGNGVRAVALWAARSRRFPARLTIETGAGVLEADGAADPPWFALPLGRIAPRRAEIEVAGRRFEGVVVRAGVPHFVVEVDDAFAPGSLDAAPSLRAHPAFGEEGTNVDVISVEASGRLRVRYFERGVEGETLSSGTGSIACAVAAVHLGRAVSPVVCRSRIGLENRVTLRETAAGTEAILAGVARLLFAGRLSRDLLERIAD